MGWAHQPRCKSAAFFNGHQNQFYGFIDLVLFFFILINCFSIFYKKNIELKKEKTLNLPLKFMEKSSLYQLVKAFSPTEQREARKFLQSPFFNQREDVVTLFEYLCSVPAPQREKAWHHLYGEAPFDLVKLRLVMSYLHTLLEQYVSTKAQAADKLEPHLYLLEGYRKRGLEDAFERTFKELERDVEAQPLRNARYHAQRYRLYWEAHQFSYPRNPTDLSRLPELLRATEVHYLVQKLHLVCLMLAHQSVYQAEAPELVETDALVVRATQSGFADLPAVAVFLNCYQMLRHPEAEQYFQGFKALLLEGQSQYDAEEMHGFYILAVNYCIRRLNAGDERFFREVLDLYKEGLSTGYLFENGQLSRFTYHNIMVAGLQSGDLDWVRFFLHEYKNRLEKPYRESSFSFSLARLEYAQQRYGPVLELLQKANYRDPLLNLAAKTLLLKTYFNTGEHDLLQSHLDAMRNYLHRKRVIGYHKTNYLNLIRYSEKILRLNALDRKSVEALRLALESEEILSEKPFLLKILGNM